MSVRFRTSVVDARTALRLGSSAAALGAALVFAAPAFAQASTHIDDPRDSSSSAANPNEAANAAAQKRANANLTGDLTPAQTDNAAQAGAQAVTAAGGSPDQAEVVVTGFRRSLESAVAEKKNRDQIVESVSAEDIGKLPDASIAESIARLPGLTSQRVEGRASAISIRGFSPDLSSTLLNGREQTSTGDNRAVEYDQYPSEVINQVIVYKSPEASIVGQGLSGTVDLRTIRPLEYGKRTLSFGARGVDADIGALNAGSNQFGYRVNGTFVDQFADDHIGIALAAAYDDEPYQYQQFNAWGYGGAGPNNAQLIGGSKSYVTSTDLKRFGVNGTLEVKATDHFTSTLDGFYSDFREKQHLRGIELPLGFGGGFGVGFDPTTATVSNGQYVSGTFTNVRGVVRNDISERNAKLYSFGWNNRYKSDDGWSVTNDLSYSKTDRNELVFESYSGTGYAGQNSGSAADTIGFTSTTKGTSFTHQLNYADPNLIQLTDPLGWGGSNVQEGYYNNRLVHDRIWQDRMEVQKEFDGSFISSVQLGVNDTDHVKSLTPDESLVQLANGALMEKIPSQYLLAPTNLAYLGLGPIVSYDAEALLNAGILKLVSNNANPDVEAKAYSIHENLMTVYAQANIKSQLGASELTGNFGVQAIDTSQHSNGYYINPTTAALTATRQGASYWDVLPSLNLSLRLPSDFVFRLALSRETMRPRMDDMSVALSYGANTQQGYVQGSSGNPQLRPYRANAADFNVEKYFGNKGYIAAQFFYKKLIDYVVDMSEIPQPYNFAGLPVTGFQTTNPAGPLYVSPLGLITTPYDVSGGSIYGVEVAGTLPLGQFAHALDGFGLTGSGSYTKSQITLPSTNGQTMASDIPGYSRFVASGTGYFEKWGFSLRGSVRYRSSFVGEVSGFAANLVNRRAAPETIVDGQIGYDFSGGLFKGLSVYFQGENLTNEPFATQNPGQPLQVIDYQVYGRRYLAGFTFKF